MFLIGFYADDTSVGHTYYSVGVGSKALVVGYDYEGRAELVAKVEKEFVERCPVCRVEAARRFVGQHYSPGC